MVVRGAPQHLRHEWVACIWSGCPVCAWNTTNFIHPMHSTQSTVCLIHYTPVQIRLHCPPNHRFVTLRKLAHFPRCPVLGFIRMSCTHTHGGLSSWGLVLIILPHCGFYPLFPFWVMAPRWLMIPSLPSADLQGDYTYPIAVIGQGLEPSITQLSIKSINTVLDCITKHNFSRRPTPR